MKHNDKEDIGKVFVYGTLKVGGSRAKTLDKVRMDCKKCTVRGKLYSFTQFPAMRIDCAEEYEVHGEIHTYKIFNEVIEYMDLMECYHGEGEDNLYNRIKVEVRLEDGSKETAFTYVFARPVSDHLLIKNGIWKV